MIKIIDTLMEDAMEQKTVLLILFIAFWALGTILVNRWIDRLSRDERRVEQEMREADDHKIEDGRG